MCVMNRENLLQSNTFGGFSPLQKLNNNISMSSKVNKIITNTFFTDGLDISYH